MMTKMNGGDDCEEEINALEFGVPIQTKINISTIGSDVVKAEMENNADEILLLQVENNEASERTTMFYLRQRIIWQNMIVMAYMWAATSFTYYMISFQLKYLPGNVYNNSLASGLSEMVAIAIAGFMYSKLGLKVSFTILYLMSFAGGMCVLFIGSSDSGASGIWMPIFVVLAKFGISGAFVLLYVSTTDVFPTLFCATALGFCNFFARILTILAPEIAERDPPLPMTLFVILTGLGSVLIWVAKPLKE